MRQSRYSLQYRPDIDGLRAIAVAAVILFHAQVPGFEGGYIGVDVFFVISGYLITSILSKSLEHHEFSIINFYERRIRRIFPALFFIVFCTVPLAWLWMRTDDFKSYAGSILYNTFLLKGQDSMPEWLTTYQFVGL